MATDRVYNFSAGPACLPMEVLQEAQADLISYKGSGMSVMEMSHRSKEFESIIKGAEEDLRKLLSIPENYKVLFLQGGASTQFAALALNFTAPGDAADYVVTGAWSKKAFEEAGKLGVKANLAAKGDNKSIPPRDSWKLTPGAKYVHYCDNETIGVRMPPRMRAHMRMRARYVCAQGPGAALGRAGGRHLAAAGPLAAPAQPNLQTKQQPSAGYSKRRSPLRTCTVPLQREPARPALGCAPQPCSAMCCMALHGHAAPPRSLPLSISTPTHPCSANSPRPSHTPQGVEFTGAPDVGDVPLVSDMSSNFLSKPVDVSK